MINQIYIHRATQNMEHIEAHRTQQQQQPSTKENQKQRKQNEHQKHIYIQQRRT